MITADVGVRTATEILETVRQRVDRTLERPQRCAQNIVAIDARHRTEDHRHLRRGADFFVERFAILGVELLGIVEPARDPLGIEDYCGGNHWSGRLRRGTALHLTDLQGGANVSALFYNAEQPLERYNMPDTLKAQHTAHYGRGHVLMSDMGRAMASVTQDTLGWHDPLGALLVIPEIRVLGVRIELRQTRMRGVEVKDASSAARPTA